MTAKIYALTNQKGGVGKTTSTVNLAASLAAMKKKVLLLDLDPQGNASVACGVDKDNLNVNMTDFLLGKTTFEQTCFHTDYAFDICPTDGSLTAAEIKLLDQPHRERQLKSLLDPIRQAYDFILIDCPPSLNILTVNAIVASDEIIVPLQCEYFALEGLAALLHTIDRIRQDSNRSLKIGGILRTMYDGRNRLTIEVSETIQKHFQDRLFHTIIPRNVRLAEAPSHGMPVLAYDSQCQGAQAYLALASELLSRQGVEEKDIDQKTQEEAGV